MKRKTARLLYYAIAAIGFVFLALGFVGFPRVCLYVGIAMMVACTWIGMQFNRCPHCGTRFGSWHKMRVCPECGKDVAE